MKKWFLVSVLGVFVFLVILSGCVSMPGAEGGVSNRVLKVETGDETWKTAWFYNIENYISTDATYTYSVRIYHEEATSVKFNLTLKTAENQYKPVFHEREVPPATWVTIEATYMLNSADGAPSDIYIEPQTSGIVFYFDDFVIKDEAGEVVLKTDFEDGTPQGWQGNNSTIEVVYDPAQ
ncbi:carbohydrate binding domain-containing protein [Thermotoga sp. SG1]|uniref:carbohydrate binding domain-containing protein n=1 Tax=Thermotoga sp. SG1 TaxID=126739 RepID=UPI000C790E78|nr:carbohydrate binding domain-containing protein [Thermotoga sp. SG1]PLV57659.1 carbohydrate-binding protein [Thermotoga sp. SG1]